jgi:hypothetical protein
VKKNKYQMSCEFLITLHQAHSNCRGTAEDFPTEFKYIVDGDTYNFTVALDLEAPESPVGDDPRPAGIVGGGN